MKIIFSISLLTLLFACSNPKQSKEPINTNESKDAIAIQKTQDSTTIAIISYPTSSDGSELFENCNPCKGANLTTNDLIEIQQILIKCLDDYNLNQEKQFEKRIKELPESSMDKKDFLIDIKNYKRQYIAIYNDKGEKEVLVNCFCNHSDWKNTIVGRVELRTCYFSLKVNLTTRKYYDLLVNGVA